MQLSSLLIWRTGQWFSSVISLIVGSSKTNNLFTAIDVNASDRVICAGMERDKESDVYLLFWWVFLCFTNGI